MIAQVWWSKYGQHIRKPTDRKMINSMRKYQVYDTSSEIFYFLGFQPKEFVKD